MKKTKIDGFLCSKFSTKTDIESCQLKKGLDSYLVVILNPIALCQIYVSQKCLVVIFELFDFLKAFGEDVLVTLIAISTI